MSRLCCEDEKKVSGESKEQLYVISDEEIQKVIEESVCEKRKTEHRRLARKN